MTETHEQPEVVTVLVAAPLLAGFIDEWSEPVQVQINRTPGIGTGYEMIARTHTHDGSTSDGFHTFDELYRFRMLYNAALFNHWATHDPYGPDHHGVHKSWRHHDGEECFGGGWFIVMATLPTGQISNHYPAADWDLFAIPEKERADEYDGHTPEDVDDRITALLHDDARSWAYAHGNPNRGSVS